MKDNFESEMTEMLILQVAAPCDTCGYDISQQVLERSKGRLALREGDLYPMLHRLERQGFLESYWTSVDAERRRKFYRVTSEGQMLLESRRAQWRDFSVGVDGVLGASRHGALEQLTHRPVEIAQSTQSTMSTQSIRRGGSTNLSRDLAGACT